MKDEKLQEVFDELGGEQAAREALLELAADRRDQKRRAKMCAVYADALAQAGKYLWVQGAVLGRDRAEGRSPFDFGNDDIVGLATVCQVGGELTKGAMDVLKAKNLYAAQALIRQIVEVEYLANAFAEKDEIAAQWMRADRDERRKFWSPAELRKRSDGKFLREDYWDHCDRGGHPTREALPYLPEHQGLPPAFVWADLAGHLYGTWAGVVRAVEVRGNQVGDHVRASFPEVAKAQADWLDNDQVTLVLRAMHGRVRRP
jgi:hypothetical protein